MTWLNRWNTPHAPLSLLCCLGERPVDSRCSRNACWLCSHGFCFSSLKCKNTCYFLCPQNSPTGTDPILMEKRNICLVGVRVEGIWTALGTSFPIPAVFSHVQSGRWSQLSYLPHDSYLTWLKGNIPSVCPIEFTVNPVYSKTFGSIYCFLDEPFSLGTIHIGSLYPL